MVFMDSRFRRVKCPVGGKYHVSEDIVKIGLIKCGRIKLNDNAERENIIDKNGIAGIGTLRTMRTIRGIRVNPSPYNEEKFRREGHAKEHDGGV